MGICRDGKRLQLLRGGGVQEAIGHGGPQLLFLSHNASAPPWNTWRDVNGRQNLHLILFKFRSSFALKDRSSLSLKENYSSLSETRTLELVDSKHNIYIRSHPLV